MLLVRCREVVHLPCPAACVIYSHPCALFLEQGGLVAWKRFSALGSCGGIHFGSSTAFLLLCSALELPGLLLASRAKSTGA